MPPEQPAGGPHQQPPEPPKETMTRPQVVIRRTIISYGPPATPKHRSRRAPPAHMPSPATTEKQPRFNGKAILLMVIAAVLVAGIGGGGVAKVVTTHKPHSSATANLPSVTIAGAWTCVSEDPGHTGSGASAPIQRVQDCSKAKHYAKQVLTAKYGQQVSTPPYSQEWGYGQDNKPSKQFACLDILWSNESSWDEWAKNPGSPAFGIPQADGHGSVYAYGDWLAQVRWGLNYIAGQYGTPCNAWTFWQRTDPRPFPNHWY